MRLRSDAFDAPVLVNGDENSPEYGLYLRDEDGKQLVIDRVAMEQLRTERLAEIDRISKNLLIAVADVAEGLTSEQRKVLDQRMQEFRGKRRGWHRG